MLAAILIPIEKEALVSGKFRLSLAKRPARVQLPEALFTGGMMHHYLKRLRKSFCLFALSCALLALALFGTLSYAPKASAATNTLHKANAASSAAIVSICRICIPSYDIYVDNSGNQIRGYNGTSSALIDNNQIGMTNGGLVSGQFGYITAVFARGYALYEVRQSFLFKVVLGGCTNTATGYCLTELDDNPTTESVATGGSGLLYQTHTDGTVWQLTEVCYHCWTLIDNTNAIQIVAGGGLYERRSGDTIWRYNGCGNSTCWTEIDSNPTIFDIEVGTNGVLYERRNVFSGGNLVGASVLKGIGPFNFQTLDTTDLTDAITASTRLYQVDEIDNANNSPQSILLYTGGNPAWENLGTAATTAFGRLEPGTGSDALYEMHGDNSLWKFTPEAGFWTEITSQAGSLSEPSGFVLFGL
jgi:hypothetical protein